MQMAKTFAMLAAGALALVGIASASAQEAPTITMGSRYDAAYHRTLDTIKNNYVYASQINPEVWAQLRVVHGINSRKELDAAVANAIALTGSDISRLSRSESDADKARVASGFIGFGLSLETVTVIGNQGIVIHSVEELSPAEDAGLEKGDLIVAIEGANLEGKTTDDVRRLMRGEDGQRKTLIVVRKGFSRTVTVINDVDGTIGITYAEANPVSFPAV